MASPEVLKLIADQVFGSYVKLKNTKTGEEILVQKLHYSMACGNKSPIIEMQAVLPDKLYLFEAAKALHDISTKRIIDFSDNREWTEIRI